MENFKTGIEEITEERQLKQIEKNGYTAQHSINHPEWYNAGQLEMAAMLLIVPQYGACPLNWNPIIFRKYQDRPRKERLRIAGAFLAAELDRLNLMESLKTSEDEKGA